MYDKKLFPQDLAIERFIFAIEQGFYVEAHELLEEDWKAFKKLGEKKKAKALQGLINGATALALFHIKKRPEGYKKVWPVYEKYKYLFEEITLENIEKYHHACKVLERINNEISF